MARLDRHRYIEPQMAMASVLICAIYTSSAPPLAGTVDPERTTAAWPSRCRHRCTAARAGPPKPLVRQRPVTSGPRSKVTRSVGPYSAIRPPASPSRAPDSGAGSAGASVQAPSADTPWPPLPQGVQGPASSWGIPSSQDPSAGQQQLVQENLTQLAHTPRGATGISPSDASYSAPEAYSPCAAATCPAHGKILCRASDRAFSPTHIPTTFTPTPARNRRDRRPAMSSSSVVGIREFSLV